MVRFVVVVFLREAVRGFVARVRFVAVRRRRFFVRLVRAVAALVFRAADFGWEDSALDAGCDGLVG